MMTRRQASAGLLSGGAFAATQAVLAQEVEAMELPPPHTDGGKPLVQAIHDYEAEMLRYSTEAVAASRKQMISSDMIHRPIVGSLQLGLMRAVMRVINAVPLLKRRMLQNIMRVRGAN